MTDTKPFNTVHLNIWGAPGIGRSALAHRIHAKLLDSGHKSHFVQNYASELGMQGLLAWKLGDEGIFEEHEQFLISSRQYERQIAMDGLVEVIITEAPLLQQAIFAPGNYQPALLNILNELTVGMNNIDVMLSGDIRNDYKSNGRIQNRDGAKNMEPEILRILNKYRPSYMALHLESAEFRIIDAINSKLRPLPKRF